MKKKVIRLSRIYEAKPDFRTPTGGSAYAIRNNPLAKNKGSGGGG